MISYAAAPTTSAAVSRNASNALMPNAQAEIHQTSPTVRATRTAIRRFGAPRPRGAAS